MGQAQNGVVRLLVLCLVVFGLRFAYVIVIKGESCDSGDGFCFMKENPVGRGGFLRVAGDDVYAGSSSAVMGVAGKSSPEVFGKRVLFFINVFQDLMVDGVLNTRSKAFCVGADVAIRGADVANSADVEALKEIGVDDVATGNFKDFEKGKKIGEKKFDFVFSGDDVAIRNFPASFPGEVCRSLKIGGYFVSHISTKSDDSYVFNSFVSLFNCCKLVHTRRFDAYDNSMPEVNEIVMKKVSDVKIRMKTDNKCAVPGFKYELVKKAEPLIMREPLKPWIALKKNIENVKYLSTLVDISFKRRYVYVDVGSRSYGSSIVSWFKKQYPKQNKTFHIYAVEADKHFHEQYKGKKGVTLLPFAAWVKNESLVFEINQTPGDENVEKGRGMGRIQPVESGGGIVGSVDEIRGFDFAEWLKDTVTEQDFVVMKMDVEGTEFDLIPRLIETGAICLVDEVFLECHYNRWQKCCPGVRSPKYQKTYGQCLDLFKTLRQLGVLVHQWW